MVNVGDARWRIANDVDAAGWRLAARRAINDDVADAIDVELTLNLRCMPGVVARTKLTTGEWRWLVLYY